MKIGKKDDTLKTTHWCVLDDPTGHKKYATELVRQLEVVTMRNPQLELGPICKVSSVSIICSLAFKTVLAELARCLTLFSNLQTVQPEIDVISSHGVRRTCVSKHRRSLIPKKERQPEWNKLPRNKLGRTSSHGRRSEQNRMSFEGYRMGVLKTSWWRVHQTSTIVHPFFKPMWLYVSYSLVDFVMGTFQIHPFKELMTSKGRDRLLSLSHLTSFSAEDIDMPLPSDSGRFFSLRSVSWCSEMRCLNLTNHGADCEETHFHHWKKNVATK